jgi:membrane-associated phospholipid phosphatase
VIGRFALALVLLVWPTQSLDDAVRAEVLGARQAWLDAPMHAASDQARPLLVVASVGALAVGAAGRALVIETAVVLAPVNLVVEGLKRLTFRARPDGTRRRSNAAFPSSHSANAFAVAFVLARRWRRSWPAWFALAATVAYSRLYLDRHWFSDVTAGALLGVLLASLALGALDRWRRERSRADSAPIPA